MGVMACSRQNCKNIMCDRSSPIYGNICDDCFIELVGMGADVDVNAFIGYKPVWRQDAYDKFDAMFPSKEWFFRDI